MLISFMSHFLTDRVNESLDKAIMTMKKGEKAQVFVFSDHMQGCHQASETEFVNPKLLYEVKLLDFTKVYMRPQTGIPLKLSSLTL